MPVQVEFEWRGPALLADVDRGVLRVLNQAGQIAERRAYALAPVGDRAYTDPQGHEHPGFLRDSTYVIVEPSGAGEYVLILGNNAPYAIFVILGTYRSAGQDFLRPAGDEAAQYIAQALGT